ncbi:MAG: homoserine O-acetyltransferase [Gemmatimonadota bacterium]|jgi:homoserine O-acetyltransferase|nr:homoserine O-acetyltransferase [Gemmatimonadota bacterium]
MNSRTPYIHRLESFELESGEVLKDVRQAYYLDGELNAERDNLVIVFHALTGSADAVGDWWKDVLGPGRAVDTDQYAILCINFVGSCYGSTGPCDPGRDPFPALTTRDLARLNHAVVESLGVNRVRLATGGSLGGMVALEWMATFPGLTDRAVVFAAPAEHTAAAIGWNHIQRTAIAQATEGGLEIARMVAMMTYRTAGEFDVRFGRTRSSQRFINRDGSGNGAREENSGRTVESPDSGSPSGNGDDRSATSDPYAIESYLSRHGQKLRERFDTRSYLTLLDVLDSHDVGRGRDGIQAALAGAGSRIVGVGIPGDLLYREEDVLRWVSASGASYRQIHSIRGHDAFLLEPDQVGPILTEALKAAGEYGTTR